MHVSADRLGVKRATTQGSEGGNRNTSVVAVLAGIDVKKASPASIVTALSALEESLDKAIAEANGHGAPSYAPYTTVASRVAAQVRDSVAALGFCELEPVSVSETKAIPVEPPPQPTPGRPVASLLLLVGTLATLLCGIGSGWFLHIYWERGEVKTKPQITRPTETIAKSAEIAAEEPGPDPGEVTPPPVLATADGTDGIDATATSGSMPASDASVAVVAPDETVAVIVQPVPDQPRPAPQPAARTEPDGAIKFHVECKGTEAGDRIQLFRTANGQSMGTGKVAESDSVSFIVRAPAEVTSPEKIFVGFNQLRFGTFGATTMKQLSHIPNNNAYMCKFEVKSATGAVTRQIEVTVTAFVVPPTDQ
ncbi:MAG: hypothetical protein HQ464_06525 [Planctomycetes bacterium]|nr:hypothetical protein [Planctomycetota bacterium]